MKKAAMICFFLIFSKLIVCASTNLLSSYKHNLSLRIEDNPSLVTTEGEDVTLFCKFSANRDAKLREIVWYRELEDGTSSKLLTYDAVMNITQVNKKFKTKIRGTGPRSMQVCAAASGDDGWYQCHVGVYVNRSIVERIGYSFLNILVPPKQIRIAVHDVIEGNTLFRHNFSLVCTADQSKPATSFFFTRNGMTIPANPLDDSSALVKEIAESYTELLTIRDESDQVSIELKKGKLQVPITANGLNKSASIEYTTIHLKGRREGTKLWESTSYLLWVLRPDTDMDAEYGCKAQHEGFNQTKTVEKTLRPPKTEWLVIESKPMHPVEGGSVMLEVNRKNLQNSFPSPVLLWTNEISAGEGRRFYVGNRILVRNLHRNNTEYKVQAFNALGSATSSKKVVLRKRRDPEKKRLSAAKFPNFRMNNNANTLTMNWLLYLASIVFCTYFY